MKFFDTIKATILCIKFPFLYPRNRWTGKHYNNWKLIEYHRKNWEFAYTLNKETYKWEIKNRWLAIKIKIADFLDDFLWIFHCLPTYTELDSMETGWRKAFGIQMCKEIKAALKKNHCLYKYRITDIKEKFGGLRWYDAGAPKEVYDIITKYEQISYHTCIMCGKPATYISRGWISPYCSDCAYDREHDGNIEEKYDRISE